MKNKKIGNLKRITMCAVFTSLVCCGCTGITKTVKFGNKSNIIDVDFRILRIRNANTGGPNNFDYIYKYADKSSYYNIIENSNNLSETIDGEYLNSNGFPPKQGSFMFDNPQHGDYFEILAIKFEDYSFYSINYGSYKNSDNGLVKKIDNYSFNSIVFYKGDGKLYKRNDIRSNVNTKLLTELSSNIVYEDTIPITTITSTKVTNEIRQLAFSFDNFEK